MRREAVDNNVVEIITLDDDPEPKSTNEIIDLSDTVIDIDKIDVNLIENQSSNEVNEPLFFEDRTPNNCSSEVPLYDQTPISISSNTNEMPGNLVRLGTAEKFRRTIKKNNFKNNNNNNSSDLRTLLNEKISSQINETNSASQQSDNIVSKNNLQISIQRTDKPSVFTRLCTITNNSTQIGAPPNETADKENCSSDGQSRKRSYSEVVCGPSDPKRKCANADIILIDDKPDDSVVFVSETKISTRIPENCPQTRSTRAMRKKEKKMKFQALRKGINPAPRFTRNVRIEEPKTAATKGKQPDTDNLEKRMIVIDGSNVAYNHGPNGVFSVKGIELCLEYFEKRGFETKAIVPQMRLRLGKSSDPKRLEKLANDKKVLLTPCKNLPGNRSSSYDDRFILEIAAQSEAAVISNDNYKDLLNENDGEYATDEDRSSKFHNISSILLSVWNEIIQTRVIGFTFCNDLLIFPADPYGKKGPSLVQILHREKKPSEPEL